MEDLTFGVELEICLPRSANLRDMMKDAGIPRNKFNSTADYSSQDYDIWQAKNDCSLSCSSGFFNIEIVSPVLSGTADIELVKKVIVSIKKFGGEVNETCGVHIHIGFDGLVKPGKSFNAPERTALVNNLADITAEFDQSLMLMVERDRWSQACCRRYKDYSEHETYDMNHQRSKLASRDCAVAFGSHSQIINAKRFLSNFENKRTIEFRLLEGCLDENKVAAWIWFCQRFLHRAFSTKVRAIGRTRKFTDLLSFLRCDRADEKRGFDRNETTKGYVDCLRKLAKKHNSSKTPYYRAHCNFHNYVRPPKAMIIKNLAA